MTSPTNKTMKSPTNFTLYREKRSGVHACVCVCVVCVCCVCACACALCAETDLRAKDSVLPEINSHHHHSREKGSLLHSLNLKVVMAAAVMKQMRGGSSRMYCDSDSRPVSARGRK